jgi:hypothetical protein
MSPAPYLTAEKYQDPSRCRRAIHRVRRKDYELLFDGEQDAAVAELIVSTEELWALREGSQQCHLSGSSVLEEEGFL